MQELRELPSEFLIKHEFVISRNCINLKTFQRIEFIFMFIPWYTKIFDFVRFWENIFFFSFLFSYSSR